MLPSLRRLSVQQLFKSSKTHTWVLSLAMHVIHGYSSRMLPCVANSLRTSKKVFVSCSCVTVELHGHLQITLLKHPFPSALHLWLCVLPVWWPAGLFSDSALCHSVTLPVLFSLHPVSSSQVCRHLRGECKLLQSRFVALPASVCTCMIRWLFQCALEDSMPLPAAAAGVIFCYFLFSFCFVFFNGCKHENCIQSCWSCRLHSSFLEYVWLLAFKPIKSKEH